MSLCDFAVVVVVAGVVVAGVVVTNPVTDV
jgi:hypothetical protein